MLRIDEIALPLDHDAAALEAAVRRRLGPCAGSLVRFEVVRRGYDARHRHDVRRVYAVHAELHDEATVRRHLRRDARIGPAPAKRYAFDLRAPPGATARPVIVGTGPCGLMGGLLLARLGFRPILLERGRPVRERTRDTWDFWRHGRLDAASNVQFGEGGAGTFSDGKIYTQAKDPEHRGRRVLEEFVAAGAPPAILLDARPHIGTYRLVAIVERLRATIAQLGGEFRFRSRVAEFETATGRLRALRLEGGERLPASHVLLAIGHSARDTLEALHAAGVPMAAKPFSIGVRIEHPQALIDAARFGHFAGHPALGPADYKLVWHASNARSVYSFCMCPGGMVVAAASEPGGVVTNGMSQPARNAGNANAALVVGVGPSDFGDPSALAGVAFQRRWERRAFEAGGGDYRAPAQRVGDFLAGVPSTGPGHVIPSYRPGVRWTTLADCLPPAVVAALREAIPAFDRRLRGFALPDAVLTGVETRTSSPVRIARNADGQSPGAAGLYPAGEGAGHAGGILSAGMDGLRAAECIARDLAAAAG